MYYYLKEWKEILEFRANTYSYRFFCPIFPATPKRFSFSRKVDIYSSILRAKKEAEKTANLYGIKPYVFGKNYFSKNLTFFNGSILHIQRILIKHRQLHDGFVSVFNNLLFDRTQSNILSLDHNPIYLWATLAPYDENARQRYYESMFFLKHNSCIFFFKFSFFVSGPKYHNLMNYSAQREQKYKARRKGFD